MIYETQKLIAAATAHRACCGFENDPSVGKLHGYCVVCGVPWPCETAAFFIFNASKTTPNSAMDAISQVRAMATMLPAYEIPNFIANCNRLEKLPHGATVRCNMANENMNIIGAGGSEPRVR